MAAPILLIVEDDPYVRRFYQRLFELNHIDIQLAASGAEGLQKAKALHPRLIFLDIIMPEMNGLDVLKQLKSDPDTKAIEVIMLTNLSETDVVGEAIRNGATGFLVKSDTSDEQIIAEARLRLDK